MVRKVWLFEVAIALVLLVLLVPMAGLVGADGGTTAFGTEYVPEEDGTIYAQVFNADGSPANGATVTLTLWKSDGTKELDGVSMDYIVGTNGIYKYDFTTPADDGVYIAEVVTSSPTGYGSAEVHVSSEGGGGGVGNVTVSDIWDEPISGYTDTTTFGGILNDILGGGTMPLLFLLGILALGLIIAFFVWHSGVLAYGAAGSFFLLGIVAMGQSTGANPTEIEDAYMGLFWLCVAFTIACALLPALMREKPSKDDIYVDDVDEVTGEKVVPGEPKEKKRRSKGSKSFDKSGQL